MNAARDRYFEHWLGRRNNEYVSRAEVFESGFNAAVAIVDSIIASIEAAPDYTYAPDVYDAVASIRESLS